MDVYTTEDEQLEAVRKWWKDNGKSAIFGIVLGLGAIFGWRGWQSHTIGQSEAASVIYQRALVAANQGRPQDAKDAAMEIINTYAETGYADISRLLLAHIAAAESDYSTAAQHLTSALEQIDNESLKHEISLRLARVYIADNKLDQALLLVNNAQPGVYSAAYNELKGDVLALQNKSAEARLAYQQAISDSQTSATDLSMLNIKLDSLGK